MNADETYRRLTLNDTIKKQPSYQIYDDFFIDSYKYTENAAVHIEAVNLYRQRKEYQ